MDEKTDDIKQMFREGEIHILAYEIVKSIVYSWKLVSNAVLREWSKRVEYRGSIFNERNQLILASMLASRKGSYALFCDNNIELHGRLEHPTTFPSLQSCHHILNVQHH